MKKRLVMLMLSLTSAIFAREYFTLHYWDGEPQRMDVYELRFSLKNGEQPLKDVQVSFKLNVASGKKLSVEPVFLPNAKVSTRQVYGNFYLTVSVNDIPANFKYPDEDGFRVAIRYEDQSSIDKSNFFEYKIDGNAIYKNPQVWIGDEGADCTTHDLGLINSSRNAHCVIKKAQSHTYNGESPIYLQENVFDLESDNIITNEVKAVGKTDGTTVFHSISSLQKFSWKPVFLAEQYRFTLFDEKGNPLTQTLTKDASVVIPMPSGNFKWMVEALETALTRESGFDPLWFVAYAKPENTFSLKVVDLSSSKTILPTHVAETEYIGARKDTKMLVPNLVLNAESQGWNKMVTEGFENAYGQDVRMPIAMRCWAIAINMLNRKFGGDLTQDEITAYGLTLRSGDPMFGAFGFYWGNGLEEGYIIRTLEWALNTKGEMINGNGMETAEIEKIIADMLDAGKPVPVEIPGHVEVIDAMYTDDNGRAFVRILGAQSVDYKVVYEYLDEIDIQSIFDYEIPEYGSVRMTDAEHSVFVDSDEDGIVDYDEVHRFNSDPKKPDTDFDGISDYIEILSFVRRMNELANVSYTSGVEYSFYGLDNQKYLADKFKELFNHKQPWKVKNFDAESKIDGGSLNGLIDEPEKLPWRNADSDGDGIADGDEDKNHNGVVDIGELTDPFNPLDGYLDPKDFYDVPEGFAVYAMNQLNIEDGAYCAVVKNAVVNVLKRGSNQPSEDLGCHVASQGESLESVFIGRNTYFNDVYSRGKIEIGDNSTAARLYTYSTHKATITNENGETKFAPASSYNLLSMISREGDVKSVASVQRYPGDWIWFVNTNLENYDAGEESVVVKDGETYVLKNGAKIKRLFVHEGGNLVIEPGEMYLGSVQLNDSSFVSFSTGVGSAIVHVNGLFNWHAKFKTISPESFAKRLKIIQHSDFSMVILEPFLGTIFAPKSNVELESSDVRGRFLGKNVIVRKNVKLYDVAFEEKAYVAPAEGDKKDSVETSIDPEEKDTVTTPEQPKDSVIVLEDVKDSTAAPEETDAIVMHNDAARGLKIVGVNKNELVFESASSARYQVQIVKINGSHAASYNFNKSNVGTNVVNLADAKLSKGRYLVVVKQSGLMRSQMLMIK
ncbi:MAG: hypothetical protein MJZ05_10800 [Fibrobacter sp.]|nr:hypothetical protein [Fibrobacter sp.]